MSERLHDRGNLRDGPNEVSDRLHGSCGVLEDLTYDMAKTTLDTAPEIAPETHRLMRTNVRTKGSNKMMVSLFLRHATMLSKKPNEVFIVLQEIINNLSVNFHVGWLI